MIGYIENYDPTVDWSKHDWDLYKLNEAMLDAIELVRQGDIQTVQHLIDILVQWGYEDDLARRACLYTLDRGEVVISQELGRLSLPLSTREKRKWS